MGAWQAYGLLNMADVNRYIIDSFNNLRYSYNLAGGTYSDVTGCTVAGIDAGYEFVPGLVIGARLGRLHTAGTVISGIVDSNPATGRTGQFSMAFESTVIPYMVGGSLRLMEGKRLSFNFAVYLGYALASAKFRFGGGLGVFGIRDDIPLEGSGVCDDVSGELRYRVADGLSLGLDLHLFNARVTAMDVTRDLPASGIASGTAFRDWHNSVLAFDYNNVSAGFGVYYSF